MTPDASKWRIEKKFGVWWLKPPVGSFWGRMTDHGSFGEARVEFIDKTRITQRAKSNIDTLRGVA